MAELNLSSAQKLAAAASALTLTTGRRLARNFQTYRNCNHVIIDKDMIINLWAGIKHNCYSLHNLLVNEQSFTPFYVTVSGEINDHFEELHRALLYFPADKIDELIPVIDKQRAFWTDFTNTEFYGDELACALEHSVAHDLNFIKIQIDKLPESAIL